MVEPGFEPSQVQAQVLPTLLGHEMSHDSEICPTEIPLQTLLCLFLEVSTMDSLIPHPAAF
jgi:hypothetical protein